MRLPGPPVVAPRDAGGIAEKMEIRARRSIDWITQRAWGVAPRLCPICGHEGMFSPVRNKPGIWCPGCDSRPRHRLLKLWMDRVLDGTLPEGARILHFAAEPWVRTWFETRGCDYVTADINDRFDMQLDITAMDLPDRSVDLVMANHVLEHVDDRAALSEIFRVLRPGGRAVLTVPMIEGWDETLEIPGLDAEARALHYGDPDHLRFYGRDFRDRIAHAGFRLTDYTAREPEVSAHALHRGERIFVGETPTTGAENG